MSLRLLTGGLHGRIFQSFIQENYPEIEVFLSASEEESENLLPKVNMLAGFNFLKATDLSHIKWVHSFGAGIDSFLIHKLPSDLLLSKTTGNMGNKIAEYCLAYILQDIKEIKIYEQQQKEQLWKQEYPKELSDVNIYIFGTGFIGQSIARMLKPLVKKVIGINTSGETKEGFRQCLSMNDVNSLNFEEQAVVINALPLTSATHHVFKKELFSLMKQVLFINIGRGASVEEEGLLKALEKSQLRTALLDVFEKEPLPEGHPFWKHQNIIITPHISGITTFDDIKKSFNAAYDAYKAGKTVPHTVDLDRQY